MTFDRAHNYLRELGKSLGNALDACLPPAGCDSKDDLLQGLAFDVQGAGPRPEAELNSPLLSKARGGGKDNKPATGAARIDKAPLVEIPGGALQLSQTAWNKLSPDIRDRIRNPQTGNEIALAAIAGITLNTVAKFRPEYVNNAVLRVLNYPGRPSLLKQVFDRCGTYDPIVAGKNLDVNCIPAAAVPEGMRQEVKDGEFPGDSERSKSIYSARSDAGVVLVGSPHVLTLKDDPEKIVAVGGRRLMASHGVTLFGVTPEVVAERRKATSKIANKSVLESLRGVSLSELLQSDELSQAARKSPLLARNLQAFQELVPLVQRWHGAIQNAMFGAGVLRGKVNYFHLKTDSGGELLSWCEANIDVMPEALQLDLNRLLYSPDEVPFKEQRCIIGRLAMFRVSRSTINLAVALAPVEADLEAFNLLPTDDPLFSTALAQSAQLTIASIMSSVPADTGGEIPLDKLPVLLHAPIVQFRKAMNERVLTEYSQEFYQALGAFKPIFCDGDHLKDSFRDESIPVDALKSTLYGAEIGQRIFEGAAERDKRFSALSRYDFYYLREALYYHSISPDRKEFTARLSVPDFKELVLGVVTAHRKANGLDAQYRTWCVDNRQGAAPLPAAENAHVVEPVDVNTLLGWTPIVVKGSKIAPSEEFALRYGINLTHSLKAIDFAFTSESGVTRNWDKTAPQWRLLDSWGLCNFAFQERHQEHVAHYGKEYVPGTACADLAERVKRHIGNPFFRPYLLFSPGDVMRPFVAIRNIESALKLEAIFADEELKSALSHAASEEEIASFNKFLETHFLLGGVVSAHDRHQLQLKYATGKELLGTPQSKVLRYSTFNGEPGDFTVEWHDARNALATYAQVLEGTLPCNELAKNAHAVKISAEKPTEKASRFGLTAISRDTSSNEACYQGFTRRLSILSSQEGTEILDSHGYLKIDHRTSSVISSLPHWIAAQHMPFRIGLDLIAAAAQIPTQLKLGSGSDVNGPVKSGEWFRFETGVLVINKGKKHQGKPVGDVLSNDPTYITKFILGTGADAARAVALIEQAERETRSAARSLTLEERREILNKRFRELLRPH